MNVNLQDTIAAIASAPGPAIRGIIRVTGPEAVSIVLQLASSNLSADDDEGNQNRRLTTQLSVDSLQSNIPVQLMLWPTNRSFTGQPMAEIHMPGSPPLMDAVLEQLFGLGIRAADRGEFTLRAFLTGRIDLVQAEAVLGVIDASDHAELETALTQLGGGVTQSLRSVRDSILSLLGDLEAGLDFVEEDIEFVSTEALCSRLNAALELLESLDDQSATRLPSGRRPQVVLAGVPNAGKSTLFNALVGETRAIVSDVAGTTRDVLKAVVAFEGTDFELIDTAGWEAAADDIMIQAEHLRGSTLQHCDVILWCEAADTQEADRSVNDQLKRKMGELSAQLQTVVTRCDLVDPAPLNSDSVTVSFPPGHGGMAPIADEAGESAGRILQVIRSILKQDQSSKGELLGATAVRCRDSLKRTIQSLKAAIAASEIGAGDEIVSMELRDALQQLSTILGEVYTDDILDHIFSNFCIGK